jgi:predicted HD phosphohydrolase
VSEDDAVTQIVAALEALVGLPYDGEPVDQLQHALQCADLARRDGAAPELVLAALLHDVARSPAVAGEPFDAGPVNHGEQGARWLTPLLGERVARLAAAHVEAKRFLVAVDPAYADGLTDVSTRTLQAQGGPMTAEEVTAFELIPGWQDAVRLRRWDDAAKDPGAIVPGIEAYVSDLRAGSRSLHTRR